MKARQKSKGLLFVISGPSGSGKTTLSTQVLKDRSLSKKLGKSVSFTTRPKRSGERDKKDYFFISESRFRRQLAEKKILEWTSYLGYYYGTPKTSVDKQIKQGRHLLLCVDLKGSRRLKRLYSKNAVTVFIMPPSLAELRRRITKRCSQTKAKEVQQRIEMAKKELHCASAFDHCLVNRDFKSTVRQLKDIIVNRIGG